MAALDFPSSPTDGQVYTAPNGVSYVYSTTYGVWQVQSVASSTLWRQLFTTTLGAAAADIQFRNIAADINHIHCEFDIFPTTDLQNPLLQFYDASDVLVTTGYAWASSSVHSSFATNAAPLGLSSGGIANSSAFFLDFATAGNQVATATGMQGQFFMRNIRASSRIKNVTWTNTYGSNTHQWTVNGGGHHAAMLVSGVRLSFGAGNVGAGSMAALWGSP